MRLLTSAVALLALLTACTREPAFTPTPIAFADHPSILHGPWTGSLTGQALYLDLTATYDTSSAYTVGGTGTLDTDPLTVTGTVTGGSAYRYLRPQTSPVPAGATLTLRTPDQAVRTLSCVPVAPPIPADLWAWSCRPAADEAARFTLRKGTP